MSSVKFLSLSRKSANDKHNNIDNEIYQPANNENKRREFVPGNLFAMFFVWNVKLDLNASIFGHETTNNIELIITA